MISRTAFPLNTNYMQSGLTIRQWYKGMIIQALINRLPPDDEEYTHEDSSEYLAKASGEIADALLAEDDEKHGVND